MRDGAPAYVTAVGCSNTYDGWRDQLADGGIVLDRAWKKKQLEKIVRRIRDSTVGHSGYSAIDFLEDVKCACAPKASALMTIFSTNWWAKTWSTSTSS
jgi:hypothetical protein